MTTTPQPLAAWRTKRGLNVAELARKVLLVTNGEVTVSEDTIRNIEAARTTPNVDTARVLAEALGVTLNDVVWPTTAQARVNAASRRNRYFPQNVQFAMFAAVFSVVSDQPPERRVSLDNALSHLEATLRNQGVEDDEIARAQARVRELVEEERRKQQQQRTRSTRQEVEARRLEVIAWLASDRPTMHAGKVEQVVSSDSRAEPSFRFPVFNHLGFNRYISTDEDFEQLKVELAQS
jgi:transcriptional regulator with XRE-family HTH domain